MSSYRSTNVQAWQVVTAGISALILTVGLARFAYTPLLPLMREQAGLGDAMSGWLATLNYAGYMAGTLLATALHDPRIRGICYRVGLLIAVVSTAAMGMTENLVLWGVLRFLAGLTSVAGMLLGSGMVLAWLVEHGRRPELGPHFAGMGLGIAVSGVVASVMAASHLAWDQQWLMLGALGLVLLVPAWRWMPIPSRRPRAATNPGPGSGPAKAASAVTRQALLLHAAYFCAGVGYVISATFLVAVITRQPMMGGGGNLAWIVVGLAAAPAMMFWERIARRLGSIHALRAAYGVQIISFFLPIIGGSLALALLGAVLYGATFIGIVGLTLVFVGRRDPANPARAMARLTLSYGIGQTVAPAIAGIIVARTGSYDGALLMAAVAMAGGLGVLLVMNDVG